MTLETGPELHTKEAAPKYKLYVPPKWGEDLLPGDALLIWGNEEFRQEAKTRLAVDGEIRESLRTQGVELIEGVPPSTTLNSNEYVALGSTEFVGDENVILREVVPELKTPKTVTFEEYLSEQNKTFPVVVYYKSGNGGMGKYLIEDEVQLAKMTAFLNEEGSQMKEYFYVKEFIDTPSNHYTSYRVVTASSGEILASGLLYSGNLKNAPTYQSRDIDPSSLGLIGSSLLDFLNAPQSPYYLHSRKFISNIAGGGGIIPLNPSENSRSITSEELEILQEHDIASDQSLPAVIADWAEKIGSSLGRRMSLVTGIDFIQDQEGNFYYLETNAEPGLETYRVAKNNGEGDTAEIYKMVMTEAISTILK